MSTFISDFEAGLLIIIMPSCQAIVMFWLAQRMVELGISLRQDPSWLRPEWAQESPLLATGFFLDAFAVSPRVFSVGRGRVVTPRNHPGPTGSPKRGRVCDDPRPMRRWMFTAWLVLKFGHHQKWWCLQCFQAVNAQPKFLGCQPQKLTTVSCCMPAPLEGQCLVVKWCCIVVD